MATPEALTHAMANRSRQKMVFAATLAGGIYSYLSAAGKIEMEDGGPEIENPIITGSNPNVSNATYYDTVTVDETNEFDTVLYNMTRLVGTLVMSDQEADENKGDAKIIDILSGKLEALEHAIKKKQRTDAVSLTTGAAPNGIRNLVVSDPTTGTVGGMPLASEPLFRNSAYDFDGGLSETNIEEAFDDIFDDLTHDSEMPNVIFVGRNIWRMHKAAARDKAQISLSSTGFGKKLINLGIKGTTHQGTTVIYDEYMAANDFYFVNDQYLKLHILKGANMKVKKLNSPWNMDAIGRRYIMEYQLCNWKNYRTHAYGTNS